MTTLATTKQTNDLRFSTSKTVGKETIYVKIRLNDECKNGHQDFAITGDIYEAGKPKADRYHISGGCIHEDIAKHFPEFIPFIRLHLCDYKGIPMHPTSNGFYHLEQGFNKTKPEDKNFAAEYCEYYRLLPAQYDVLKTSKNKVQFALNLEKLGILEQWEKEANKAIKQLESLTESAFLVDSKRTQYIAPTAEEIAEENERQANGYYTPEAAEKREQQKMQDEIAKLEAERDKGINKAICEFEAKKAVLLAGGTKALNNCIYYNHTKQISFNWRGYDNLPESYINDLISKLKLPEGVTATISKK